MVENLPDSRFPTLTMDLIRATAGLSFILSGLFILLNAVRLPDSFFGAVFKLALFPFYAQWIRLIILPRALLFACLLVMYQVVFGACILAKGKIVTIGLAGYLAFLVVSLPAFGLYSLINLPLIVIAAVLLPKRYAKTTLEVFRGGFAKNTPRQPGGQ
jgi:hypothetical protein